MAGYRPCAWASLSGRGSLTATTVEVGASLKFRARLGPQYPYPMIPTASSSLAPAAIGDRLGRPAIRGPRAAAERNRRMALMWRSSCLSQRSGQGHVGPDRE